MNSIYNLSQVALYHLVVALKSASSIGRYALFRYSQTDLEGTVKIYAIGK